MSKHFGPVLVLAAFVGLGNGLGGGPGGGGAAGSVGGPSNAGAGGSPSDPSRSGLASSGSPPAPKNASLGLGPSSVGVGGGVGGSSGGSEGLGAHPTSGGSGSAGGVSTDGSSSGVSGSSGSTTSPSSAILGPGLDLTGDFGAGHGGAGVPGGAASDFGGLGSGSAFDNLNSGIDSSSGGAAAGAEGSAGEYAGFDRDQFSGRDNGFDGEYGQSWGSDGNTESSLLTRGSSGFGEGRSGGLGAWGSGGNFNGGEGAPGGGTHGYGVFNRGLEFGNFDSGSSAFGLPEGTGGGLGADGIGSRGEAGAFPASFAEPEPGDILGPEALHGGSFPSSSGFVGSPAGESPTNTGISNPDGSNNPSSSFAHVLGGFQRTRLLSRLWQSGRTGRGTFGLSHRGKKTDPRLAAAIALGTLAGVTALGSIGAGIAAAIHNRRMNGVVGLGRAPRGRVSGDGHRKRRSIPTSKVSAEILDGIPTDFERLVRTI